MDLNAQKEQFSVAYMSPWVLRLLMVCAALVVVGFGLVVASGYSGDSGGGSELVWRVGGLMMYASIPVFVTALVWGLISSHRSTRRRRA